MADSSSSTMESPPDAERVTDAKADDATPPSELPLPRVEASEEKTRPGAAALLVIASLGVLYTAFFARAVLMPITMALVLALLLRPLVRRGRRWRIPDSVGAGVLLVLLLSILFVSLANLIEPARQWVNSAPAHLKEAGEKLHVVRQQIVEFNEASEKMQQIAAGNSPAEKPAAGPFPFAADDPPDTDLDPDPPAPPTPPGSAAPADNSTPEEERANNRDQSADANDELTNATTDEPVRVEVKQPQLIAGVTYLTSTGSLLAEGFVTIVLAYFLLAAGDVLMNNVLRMMPTWSERRNVVELVHNVENGISKYLLTVAAINLGLGMVIAVAMWILGLPNPMLWGAMAALFNFVPYVGALVGVGVIAVVALLTYDTLTYAVVPPLVFWSLTALEGNIVTPHLLGRSMSLNPIVVFISLIFWGWLWGVGGALLAVPILAIAHVGLEQFERTRPISTLLGGGLRA